MEAPLVFAGILKLLKTKPVKDVVKKYGRKAYDAYKKANRKIDEKLTSKRTKESIDKTKRTNLKRKQSAKFKEEVPEKKIGSLTKKEQKIIGEGAKPQIKLSTKGNPIKGRIRKIKGLGVLGTLGGAGATAALMRDKKEPKGTTTKTTPTFKQAFAEADANNQKTFTWRGNRYTTEKAEEQRKKFETSGAGVGESTGLRKKQGGRIKMRGGGRVMLSKSRGAKYI